MLMHYPTPSRSVNELRARVRRSWCRRHPLAQSGSDTGAGDLHIEDLLTGQLRVRPAALPVPVVGRLSRRRRRRRFRSVSGAMRDHEPCSATRSAVSGAVLGRLGASDVRPATAPSPTTAHCCDVAAGSYQSKNLGGEAPPKPVAGPSERDVENEQQDPRGQQRPEDPLSDPHPYKRSPRHFVTKLQTLTAPRTLRSRRYRVSPIRRSEARSVGPRESYRRGRAFSVGQLSSSVQAENQHHQRDRRAHEEHTDLREGESGHQQDDHEENKSCRDREVGQHVLPRRRPSSKRSDHVLDATSINGACARYVPYTSRGAARERAEQRNRAVWCRGTHQRHPLLEWAVWPI